MKLVQAIQAHAVPNGAVTLWWLGQASFIIKSPNGRVIAIDPYLTNSCKDVAAKAGFNADRSFPSLIEPGELDVDVIALTHSHQDHCDPETIAGYRSAGGKGPYVAPGETMDKLLSWGVPRDEVILTWPNKEHVWDDLRLKTTFAIPYGGDDLTHTGYLVLINGGPTIYFTGDTDYNDVLGYIAGYRPDVMVTVINGAFRNLGPNEATKLAAMIGPRIIIPCHYDLFPDNSLNPRLFRTCLQSVGIADKYVALEPGKPLTVSGTPKS